MNFVADIYARLFATKSHTHTGYASSNHNHDATYSKLGHTHSDYAASNHNHDSSYAAKSHTHSTSDISGLSTGIGFPDYANGSDITSDFKNSSTHGGANRYIPNKNGWIVCTPQSKVYVNGSSLYTAHNGDAGLTNDSIFPVKSGDIITGGASNMYFFPMR